MSITQGILAASLFAVFIAFVARGEEWTDPDTGYTWTYHILADNTVEIGDNSYSVAVSPSPVGHLAIPATINGKTVARIGDGAVSGWSDYGYGLWGLTSVTIPEGVKNIGWGAFSGCNELNNIFIPNSVTNIEGGAFSECYSLQSVTIPSRVTSIKGYTFNYCRNLKNVTIPNSVTQIGKYAFSECYSLQSLTIPCSVTRIGQYAFYCCYNLRSVTIPGSVTAIGECAFSGCQNIENATISDGVVRIYNGAFSGCGLTRLLLPNSVTGLGDYAFDGCENLTSVTILNSALNRVWYEYDTGDDREFYGRGDWGNSTPFGGCRTIKNVTLPWFFEDWYYSSLRYFYPDSFASITNVVVLDGTTYISEEAFKDCEGLQSVTLPPSLLQVGSRAFEGCTSLREVIFEGSAPEVGENIYQGTTNSLVTYVRAGSIGWAGGISTDLPELWNGRAIAYIGGCPGSGATHGGGTQTVVTNCVSVTSTNVVVHYVLNSVVPNIAVPVGGGAGFVTVVTEIKGGTVAIPDSWATNYPSFTAKFGADFSSALTKPTGKRDSQGNALLVWHDYVAGTDPTNEDDVFKASIIMVDGEPVVGYTPILPENERGKRKYTIYGKARLQDELWQIVDGNPGDFNFFKVTVEMR